MIWCSSLLERRYTFGNYAQFNELACEDYNSFENYTRMPIAAIFWLLEKIRPPTEKQKIFIFPAISSLFP